MAGSVMGVTLPGGASRRCRAAGGDGAVTPSGEHGGGAGDRARRSGAARGNWKRVETGPDPPRSAPRDERRSRRVSRSRGPAAPRAARDGRCRQRHAGDGQAGGCGRGCPGGGDADAAARPCGLLATRLPPPPRTARRGACRGRPGPGPPGDDIRVAMASMGPPQQATKQAAEQAPPNAAARRPSWGRGDKPGPRAEVDRALHGSLQPEAAPATEDGRGREAPAQAEAGAGREGGGEGCYELLEGKGVPPRPRARQEAAAAPRPPPSPAHARAADRPLARDEAPIGGSRRGPAGRRGPRRSCPRARARSATPRGGRPSPTPRRTAKAQQALDRAVQAAPSPEIEKLCERIREVIRQQAAAGRGRARGGGAGEGGARRRQPAQRDRRRARRRRSRAATRASKAPPAPAAPQQGQDAAAPAGRRRDAAGRTPRRPCPTPCRPRTSRSTRTPPSSARRPQDAGMDTAPAQLVQSGPVAEARDAQGELDQAAKEDPAKVLAGQQAGARQGRGRHGRAAAAGARGAHGVPRRHGQGHDAQQNGMVGSEESMRANGRAPRRSRSSTTRRTQVNGLLKDRSPPTPWTSGTRRRTCSSAKFKADLAAGEGPGRRAALGRRRLLRRPVGRRHRPARTGPRRATPRPRRTSATASAPRSARSRSRSTPSSPPATSSIKNASDAHRQDLRRAAGVARASGPQRSRRSSTASSTSCTTRRSRRATTSTRSSSSSASAAVDEVRAEIAELRKKAGGLVGRIVDAINRFIDDPVKFIIEGLLELLGIPPACVLGGRREDQEGHQGHRRRPDEVRQQPDEGAGARASGSSSTTSARTCSRASSTGCSAASKRRAAPEGLLAQEHHHVLPAADGDHLAATSARSWPSTSARRTSRSSRRSTRWSPCSSRRVPRASTR